MCPAQYKFNSNKGANSTPVILIAENIIKIQRWKKKGGHTPSKALGKLEKFVC